MKKEDLALDLPSVLPLLAFLDKDEYSQIPFSYFRDNFPDKDRRGAVRRSWAST